MSPRERKSEGDADQRARSEEERGSGSMESMTTEPGDAAGGSEGAAGPEGAGGSEDAEAAPGAARAGAAAAHGDVDAEGEEMLQRLREELEELEEIRDRHLRLAAEFDNYRRRTREELAKTRELAQAELTGKLLDALDDLARVSSTPSDATTVEALHEGVELVERKILKELREAGLEPIDAEGEPFDPTVHEALVTSPTRDPEDDDRVGRVFVTGYRFRDRLLRPARVEVRKYEDGGGGAERDDAAGDPAGRRS